jgi:hypothetical protein
LGGQCNGLLRLAQLSSELVQADLSIDFNILSG